MKMMLISDTSHLKPFLEQNFTFQQADVIHYDNPIKAMDNLEEIGPEIVLFSATDFPRHWKPFVMFLRNSYTRHETIFVLLISDNFPAEEAEKAEFLEVNAILDEDLTSVQTLERIRGIIARYHQNIDVRKYVRYLPRHDDPIEFLFTNPYTFQFVFGSVVDISAGGLRFRPADDSVLLTMDSETHITMASLALDDVIVPVHLRIIRISESIAAEFTDLSLETEKLITDFIQFRLERFPVHI